MSLSKEMLAAIQQAGAAVFEADAQLKLAVRAYGERVHAAVGSNPYHLGNDTLFENWKMVARLSQTMAGIEEELRKVYQVATDLNEDEPSSVVAMPALSAPEPAVQAPAVDTGFVKSVVQVATDVKVKKKTAPAKAVADSSKVAARPNNADVLLIYLGTVLNTKSFTPVNQTVASKATGIALGSMTAAIKRLIATKHVVAGPVGQYRLAK